MDLITLNKAADAVKGGMNFFKAVNLYGVNADELQKLLTKNKLETLEDTFQISDNQKGIEQDFHTGLRHEKLKELELLNINLTRLQSQLNQIDVEPYNNDKLAEISSLKNQIQEIQKQINTAKKNINDASILEEEHSEMIHDDIKYEETPKSEYKNISNGTYKGNYVQINGVKHFRYEDANPEDLVDVGGIKVQKELAENFNKMQVDAKKDGVNLYIVSGTRTQNYQITVFKKKFKDKSNPTEAELYSRIRWSAPSGYSEHHTGYAIDINSTETDFEYTKEYKWLLENAGKYGFEMSFPKDNKQKVGFEPWHWRYVGNDETKKIFQLARDYQNNYDE